MNTTEKHSELWYQQSSQRLRDAVEKLERELTVAQAEIAQLRERIQNVIALIPAADDQGGLLGAIYDDLGNEIGIENIDPMGVIYNVNAALHNILAESRPQTDDEKDITHKFVQNQMEKS